MRYEAAVIDRWMLDTLTIVFTLYNKATPDTEEGVAEAVYRAFFEIRNTVGKGKKTTSTVTESATRRLVEATIAKVLEIIGTDV